MNVYKRRKKKRLILLVSLVLIIACLAGAVLISLNQTADLPDEATAKDLIVKSVSESISPLASASKAIWEQSEITVNSVESDGVGCLVNCDVKTYDITKALDENFDKITSLDAEGLKSDAMKEKIQALLESFITEENAVVTNIDVVLADANGNWTLYNSSEFADACFGNLLSYSEKLDNPDEYKSVKRLKDIISVRYDENEPDLRNWLQKGWDDFKSDFELNFIKENRWTIITGGLLNTLKITAVSLLIGVFIGILIAAVRTSFDKNGEEMEKRGTFAYDILAFFNGLSKVYLTVIRGTPVVVQLLIFYFIIFSFAKDGTPVAMLAFGINSGAYVAEIFRGGIMSIDQGQFEAGRSLGFNYVQTMIHIIIPQVFKAVLPTLCNEFITLLKETSIAGYVGIIDLTKAGDLIRGRTFSAFMPLIAVAIIYLVLVVILSFFVGKLERRLRKSER